VVSERIYLQRCCPPPSHASQKPSNDHPGPIHPFSSSILPSTSTFSNTSSTRVLSASNGGELRDCFDHIHSPASHPSIYFAVDMASEGLPMFESSSAFNEPSQAGSGKPEQIVALPEHSARGSDNQPVDGEVFWTCCECGNGPWFKAHVLACLNCGHIVCNRCVCGEQEGILPCVTEEMD